MSKRRAGSIRETARRVDRDVLKAAWCRPERMDEMPGRRPFSARRAALVALAAAAAFAACVTIPVYRFSFAGHPPMPIAEAERAYAAHIEKTSAALVPAKLDRPLKPIRIALPAGYPEIAAPVEVAARLTIGAGGDVTDVKVIKSGGWELDDRLTFVLRQWRFEPPVKDGAPTSLVWAMAVTFSPTQR